MKLPNTLFATISNLFARRTSANLEPEMISLWHASPHHFTEFDYSKIGTSSLKYGYGIYFSRDADRALTHVMGARYLYRVDLHKTEYEKLLLLHEYLQQQLPKIQDLAQNLRSYAPLDRLTIQGCLLRAIGHSLYKAACVAAGGENSGTAYERLGAQFLINNGVLGASVTEGSEEIVVIYTPVLCKIVSCNDIHMGN